MPRYARLQAPGAIVHLIARFVNRQFRLAGPAERSAYLEKLAASLQRTDWRLLGYALMSSHVHLALLAGHDAPCRLVHPLHIGVARWLNPLPPAAAAPDGRDVAWRGEGDRGRARGGEGERPRLDGREVQRRQAA